MAVLVIEVFPIKRNKRMGHLNLIDLCLLLNETVFFRIPEDSNNYIFL